MIAPVYSELGQSITFEGYATDFGKRIIAVQFSLDDGAHWTSYETSGASDERWVHWTFKYTPKRRGSYCLKIRSVNEDRKASPEASWAEFSVV